MLKKLKGYMMPIAMILGGLFYSFFGNLTFLTPYLIFVMLFFAYCNLQLKQIRFTKMHILLAVVQIFGSLSLFFLLQPFDLTLAQGVMICVLAPTATAAPVIAGMLKGNVASLTAYSLISNLSVAIVAPIIFSFIGTNQALPFFDSFLRILQPMFLLLLLPLVLVIILRKIWPKLIASAGSHAGISFYLWSMALMIVTGRTVGFVIQESGDSYFTEIMLATGSMVVCITQFIVGRKIGRKYDDTVAGGQGLGQKNTILAIWMAQTYLNPIASIGPGAYVLWQNLINSYQVWRMRKHI